MCYKTLRLGRWMEYASIAGERWAAVCPLAKI